MTAFVLLLSRHSLWLLPLGFALDVAVLHVLGRLPRGSFWPVVAWFTLVLIALAVPYILRKREETGTGPVIDVLGNSGMMIACLEQHEQR